MSVRHAMLALLSEGPKYGLRLREEFEARTGEVWPLNVGQVYTTLQRLERDGLVESDGEVEGDGPQKAFRITAAGAAELDPWLRTPPDLSFPPRDELVMKVLVALSVRAPTYQRSSRPTAATWWSSCSSGPGSSRTATLPTECGPGHRRGALPRGLGRPVAGCGRRPHQAHSGGFRTHGSGQREPR